MDAGGSDVNFTSPGDGLRSGSLTNIGGSAEFSQSERNAGISGGGIDGKSQYLFFIVEYSEFCANAA